MGTIDYSNLCWEDLWYEYLKVEEDDGNEELEAIEMELERRRDLYR